MAKIIGIDLGTTNSVVAVMEGGEPDRYFQLRKDRTCAHLWWLSIRTESAWSARRPNARL